MNQLGSAYLLSRLVPGRSDRRAHSKFALFLFCMAALIIAYANPQWGSKKEKVTARSSDVFIALDISQSMMAEDISPNRLERSKRLTNRIIRSLRGNRIGLIFFAGNAYLQMPLSSDYSAAQLFVSSANTNQASTQGTAISDAIDLTLRSFEEDQPAQRALIIITDGENHDDEAIRKAEEARESGLYVFSIGVGSPEGAYVPELIQGREQFKRDNNGEPVRSQLNTALIKDLADKGGGKSFLIGDESTLQADLKNEIDRLEKQEVEQRSFSDYSSYFQYFVALGIFLILVEFIIPERQKLK